MSHRFLEIRLRLVLVLAFAVACVACSTDDDVPEHDLDAARHDVDGSLEEGVPGHDGSVIDSDGAVPAEDAGVPPGDAGEDGGDDMPDDAASGSCEPLESQRVGTVQAPLSLTLADLPHAVDASWGTLSYLRISGLQAQQPYVVKLAAIADAQLVAFGTGSDFTTPECIAQADESSEFARCPITPSGTSLDLALASGAESQTVVLFVDPGFEVEGTLQAPHMLSQADLPHAGQVAHDASSFYEITGLEPDHTYAVTLSGMPALVFVGASATSGFTDPYDGEQSRTRAQAIVRAQSSSIFAVVSAEPGGASFELDVTEVSDAQEGLRHAPLSIELPFTGRVGFAYFLDQELDHAHAASESYYVIEHPPVGAYELAIESDEPLLLRVLAQDDYADATSQCVTGSSSGAPGRCGLHSDGEPLHVLVRNDHGAGGRFTLRLLPAAHASEGSAALPQVVSGLSAPYAASVGHDAPSYYRLTPLTPDQPYLLTLSEVDGSMPSITIFSDAARTQQVADDNAGRLVFTVAGTSAYAVVTPRGPRALGASFALRLEPIEARVGSRLQPVEIACAAQPIHGHVAHEGNWYRFTGVAPGVPHIVTLIAQDSASLRVFDDDSHVARCVQGPYFGVMRCLVAPENDFLLVRLESLHASAFTLQVEALEAVPAGTVDAPVAIDVADLPYAGRASSTAESHYVLGGLSVGTAYELDLSNAAASALLTLDGPYPSIAAGRGAPGRVSFLAESSNMRFSVAFEDPHADSHFTLDVAPAAYQPEGVGTPVALALAGLPHAGSASGARPSRYRIAGLQAGTTYVVTASVEESAQLHLLAIEDGTPFAVCTDFVADDLERVCAFQATSAAIEVEVSTAYDASLPFTLDLEPAAHAAQGTRAAPLAVDAASLALAGEIEPTRHSYYRLQGLVGDQRYRVTVTGAAEPWTGFTASGEGTPCGPWCEITADASGSYDLAFETGDPRGASFTLELIPVGYENEGTQAEPVELAYASLPYAGGAYGTGASFYRVTGLVASTRYRVEITNADAPLAVFAYASTAAGAAQCNSSPYFSPNLSPFSLQPQCSLETSTSELLVYVVGGDELGSGFSLDVIPE